MGQNPAAIQVQGSTLEMQPNQAFVMLGGGVAQAGGVIKSHGGRIELGAVQQADLVALSPEYALDYPGIQTFGDIRLSQAP